MGTIGNIRSGRLATIEIVQQFNGILVYHGGATGIQERIWSSWIEHNSEDTDIGQNGSNAYPITFYTGAALVTLTVVFLLAFTIIRSHPTIEEEGILALALFVAGACMCLARLSSSLD